MDSRVKAKVDRLSTAVSNIRSALIDKGVDATGHGAEDFATDVSSIPKFDPDDYAFSIIETTGEPIEPDPSEIHIFSNIQTDGTTSGVVNTGIYLFSYDFRFGFEIEADFDNLTDSGTGDYRRIFSCEANSSPYPGLNLTRKKEDNDTATLTLNNTNTVEIEFQLLSEHNTISVKYVAESGEVVLVANGTTVRDTVTPLPGFATYFTIGGQMWSGGTTIATDRCAAIRINSITVKPIKYQIGYGRGYTYIGKSVTTTPNNLYKDRTDIVEVQLPTSITRLGESCFSGCESLRDVNFENITHVGAKAFGWCSKMRRFNYENVVSLASNFLVGDNSRTGSVYDVEEILLPKLETVPQLIAGDYKITSTRYPNLRLIDLSGAKVIGTGNRVVESVSNDSKVKLTVVFGKDVETIKDNAFADTLSINLGTLDFPKLTNLNGSAFCRSGVHKVINLGSITTIYPNTFATSKNLVFVRIPSTVTTIGVSAFREEHSGMVMVVEAVTPPSTPAAPTADAIYVPDESVDTYKAASGWKQIASKIHPLSEYTGSD